MPPPARLSLPLIINPDKEKDRQLVFSNVDTRPTGVLLARGKAIKDRAGLCKANAKLFHEQDVRR